MDDISTQNFFRPIDYVTVAGTLFFSLAIGVYHAYRGKGKETNDELLLGGRNMKTLPIAASMLVTYFSATAIVGLPAEIFSNGIQLFWMDLFITLFCIPLGVALFVIVLYKLKLTSAYEYLEYRFDSVAVRWIASLLFILEVTFTTGLALYAPALVLEAFLRMPQAVSIVGIGLIGTVYTTIGGLKAVVWTDVFQFVLIIIGMLAIVVNGFIAVGGIELAFARASNYGRLTLFNWNVNPFERYNTLNFAIGYSLTVICFFGTHQPNVQRYSSLPTLKEAFKAMAWNFVFKEATNILIILTGIAIFAVYAECDPIKLGHIGKADEIVPYFFVRKVAWIPGMIGLFTACIFSAVLSTVSSSLNSLAAVTCQDFLMKIPFFQSLTSINKGRVTCLLTFIYGLLTIGIAFLVGEVGSIFQIMFTIIGAIGGALGGAFIVGIFFPFVNKFGVIVGMLCSMFTTSILTFGSAKLGIIYESLPTSIEGCPLNITFIDMNINDLIKSPPIEYDWPEKIFTISYILYPFIGTIITIVVGSLVSFLTVPFVVSRPINPQHIHPILLRLFSIQTADTNLVKASSELFNKDLNVMKEQSESVSKV